MGQIDILSRKLTVEEQRYLHNQLTDLQLVTHHETHSVLYDEEGDEFYAYSINDKHDFTTLSGFIQYLGEKKYEKGYSDCQGSIKHALGL